MSEKRELYYRQLQVIEDLVSCKEDEGEVLKRHGVSGRLYRKWLGQEAFVDELVRGISAARHRAMLKIARYVPAAVDGLVKMIEGEAGESTRKACLDLLAMQAKESKGSGGGRRPRITQKKATRILEVLAEKEE